MGIILPPYPHGLPVSISGSGVSEQESCPNNHRQNEFVKTYRGTREDIQEPVTTLHRLLPFPILCLQRPLKLCCKFTVDKKIQRTFISRGRYSDAGLQTAEAVDAIFNYTAPALSI